jgi:hypothetical protein
MQATFAIELKLIIINYLDCKYYKHKALYIK